ncbi:MAG: hypothetical protein ED556_11475 [Winogradskyella sp.]|uniref:hypothetical protein n=1 Tax=Winogradskyella sp. TaxID=1883156 RepID=UPI000F3B7A88|nr:hypothetical protein [Winogradskyella sp.]RNC84077.1 MAG: hypothetical protein ED556_11475 [Winogradskyella sp.]
MPLGESMQSTLKSNKRIMLDKKKHFRKSLGGYVKKPKTKLELPTASPEQLEAIRTQLKRQHKKTRITMICILVVLSLGMLYIMLKLF